jgi:hypothetical protein
MTSTNVEREFKKLRKNNYDNLISIKFSKQLDNLIMLDSGYILFIFKTLRLK